MGVNANTPTPLSTHATDECQVSIMLGGVPLYGPSVERVEAYVTRLQGGLIKTANERLTTDRALLYAATADLHEGLVDRLFNAVVGSVLKVGSVDALMCESINGKQFRVFVGAERRSDVSTAIDKVVALAAGVDRLSVRSIKEQCSKLDRNMDWAAASRLAGLVVWRGNAEYMDRNYIRGAPRVFR